MRLTGRWRRRQWNAFGVLRNCSREIDHGTTLTTPSCGLPSKNEAGLRFTSKIEQTSEENSPTARTMPNFKAFLVANPLNGCYASRRLTTAHVSSALHTRGASS